MALFKFFKLSCFKELSFKTPIFNEKALIRKL